MDDRDKDLTHLFVRDLDEIPLPPRGDWRRAPGKEHIAMRVSRSLLTAGAVAAVLVLALIVGLQLRDRTDTAAAPSTSPRPSPTSSAPGGVAPTVSPTTAASPSPVPSAGAVLNDSFGFIMTEVGASASIRGETGTTVATLNGFRFVVSPNGDRIAYVALEGRGAAVHVRTIAGGADRTGPSFGETEGGVTGMVWSTDGTGLLIASGRAADTGPVPTTPALLQAFDLSGGGPTLVATRQDGRVYAPIAWDRAAKFVAAAETGAGGFASAYFTFDLSQSPPRATSTPIAGRSSIPVASSDGKFALLSELDSKEVRYWPLADFSAIKKAGTATSGALWQPGSHRIGFIAGDAFLLFQVDDSTTATAFRGVKTGTPTQPGASIRTFRADGSAVVLAVPVGTGLSTTDYAVTRLADGASVTFQSPGGLTASVRLR